MRNVVASPTTYHLRQRAISGRVAPDTRLNVRTSSRARWRSRRHWLVLAAILLAGNLANALSWRFGVPINTGVFSVALAVGLYLTHSWSEWPWLRSALAWRPRWRPAALALGAGLALALPSVLFFAVAAGHGGVGYSPIPALPLPSLLVRELVEIPLLTALVEELVFRQYVFRMFGGGRMIPKVLTNAGIFTLWHLVVTARTVMATNFATSPVLLAGSYVGSLATVFIGGMMFAWVRWRTGSFVYSALTHWIVVGLITLAVWVL